MKLFKNLVSLFRLFALIGMPIPSVKISETNPKGGTYQYTSKRISGLRLVIPSSSGVASISNNRIVTIQEVTATQEMIAVSSPIQQASCKIIGWGVLEEALQSGGNSSIAPTPNNLVDGDTVTVLKDPSNVYMIDVDTSNVPVSGLAVAYVDGQGRLSSSSAGSNRKVSGATFSSVPGLQLAGQLKTGCIFYQMFTVVEP